MKRLPALLLLFSLLLAACQRSDNANVNENENENENVNGSVDADANGDGRQEALLSDATNIYRICSTRPQRVVPSQVSKHERSHGKTWGGSLLRSIYNNKRPAFACTGTSLSGEGFVASRDYYVFALRHIIR